MEERIKSYIEFLKTRVEESNNLANRKDNNYLQGLYTGFAGAYENVINRLETVLTMEQGDIND